MNSVPGSKVFKEVVKPSQRNNAQFDQEGTLELLHDFLLVDDVLLLAEFDDAGTRHRLQRVGETGALVAYQLDVAERALA